MEGLVNTSERLAKDLPGAPLQLLASAALFLKIVRERERGEQDGIARDGSPWRDDFCELSLDDLGQSLELYLRRGAHHSVGLTTYTQLNRTTFHWARSLPSPSNKLLPGDPGALRST